MNDNKQPGLIALCSVAVSLPTIFVFLRLWSGRLQHDHKFGWDDVFAVATLPFIWSENALIFWWISLGLGKHAIDLPAADVAQSPKIIFAAAFLYDACISLPKFSALFFYYRIFQKTNRWFYYALWTVGSLNAAWLISAWLSTLFQCTPVHKAWDTAVPGHCFPQWNWFLGTALASMVIDVFILIMPLPMLWKLHMSNTRKLMITGVFICGYAVVVVSIGRLVSLAQAGSALLDDITWGTITYIEWVQCEGPVSLISVCLPFIFHLFKGVHQHGLGYLIHGQRRSKPSASPNYSDEGLTKGSSYIDVGKGGSFDNSAVEQSTYGPRSEANAWGSWSKHRGSIIPNKNVEEASFISQDDRIYVRAEVDVNTA